MNLKTPIAVVAAVGLLATSAGSLAAQDDDGPQPPVGVSACILAGPEVHRGTEEEVVVSLPDGEMTIVQFRGFTWQQSLTQVSDPRLEGTLYHASDGDLYILPGNEAEDPDDVEGPEFETFTKRIENDEGAWQGSATSFDLADGTSYTAPMVMTGEGAYEGLTAIVGFVDTFGGDCRIEGYIIEGTIPPAPEPQTGQ